jgi:hypothetical protein
MAMYGTSKMGMGMAKKTTKMTATKKMAKKPAAKKMVMKKMGKMK